jgi:hypothetical protein
LLQPVPTAADAFRRTGSTVAGATTSASTRN